MADARPIPIRLARLVMRLSLAAILLWLGWNVYAIFIAGNIHEIIPGQLYRGAQPSGPGLEHLIHKYKIRTVLNARGCCWPDPWYATEAEVCQRFGVNLEDVCFSAVHLPSRDELRILIDVLDRAERPIFIHCRQGADRTGIASAAAVLLADHSTFEDGCRQLGLRYGHAPISKTTIIDRFVTLYGDWLTATRQEHSPERFRHWARDQYNGAWCDARFDQVRRRFDQARVGQILQYDVTVRNTSNSPWQFQPTKTAGYHVIFKVLDDRMQMLYEGRAGMLQRVVRPGESIGMVMIVPPVPRPGHYRLMVDMIEEGHCWFHQTGSPAWEEELDVRE